MSDHIRHRSSRRRVQLPSSPGRNTKHEPARRQSWAGLSTQEILARYKPGTAPPLKVLDVLIELFNTLHTSLEKTVSHKTRQERAQFLRRFFRDLSLKAGFKMAPDPRNLGQKHIHAMVQVWHDERLAPATIQTYLSFLRGLTMWMGKPGFVRGPAHYGLSLEEYQRHENARRDKSWSAQGIATDEVLAQVFAYDPLVGASLRLMQALGLRRKESVQCRPFASWQTSRIVNTPTADCPFCSLPVARIVDSDTMAVAVRDAFPISQGHTLVIPRRHVGSFFELQDSEQLAMLVLLNRARARLHGEFAPDGYTIGINDGSAAGQTVPHVHMHLIPRHAGDVPDPRGGVRWVIPDNANYWD